MNNSKFPNELWVKLHVQRSDQTGAVQNCTLRNKAYTLDIANMQHNMIRAYRVFNVPTDSRYYCTCVHVRICTSYMRGHIHECVWNNRTNINIYVICSVDGWCPEYFRNLQYMCVVHGYILLEHLWHPHVEFNDLLIHTFVVWRAIGSRMDDCLRSSRNEWITCAYIMMCWQTSTEIGTDLFDQKNHHPFVDQWWPNLYTFASFQIG